MPDDLSKPSPAPSGGGRPAAWQPPAPEELQKLLPKYEITALLGRGGMGAVYQGRQLSLDRPMALKILSAELDEREQGFAERFKNEARSMAKLNHPGIVAVHDFGQTTGGLLYIAMEFVGGTDVARMITKKGRLPPEHAMAITAHVCDALAYAHERGIIHRDIKPANIMVGYDGVVKVADFGLAKMTHSNASGLTQSGMAMGTLHYMAPEALMLGAEVDHRADIYAVGVMLYQMLTGKVPRGMFDPPSKQIPGLDPRYDSIIARAIQDDRELRYQSVMELRTDLDDLLTEPVPRVEATPEKTPAPPPAALPTQARPQHTASAVRQEASAPRKSEAPLVWGTLAGLLVIGGLGWLVIQPEERERVPRQIVEPAPAPAAPSTATTPAPAKAAAPAITSNQTAWPKDDSNFRRLGQFKLWSSKRITASLKLSMNKLRGIKDVVQVYQGRGNWVVLRANGDTISSDGGGDRKNIRRICPGISSWYALISRDGKVEVIAPDVNQTPELRPPADMKAQDAYLSPTCYALLENGGLQFWGKNFDGKKEPKNGEWTVTPTLPSGRKAVAVAHTEFMFAAQLENQSLLLWRAAGPLTPPPTMLAQKFRSFAATGKTLYGILADGSLPVMWTVGDSAVRPVPGVLVASSVHDTGKEAVCFLTSSGKPIVTTTGLFDPKIFDPVLGLVNGAAPDLISLRAEYDGKTKDSFGYLLWFDRP